MDSTSALPADQVREFSLWDRLGKAAVLDIESNSFSWSMLSSVHRTENSSSTEPSEDEMNKPLEVWCVQTLLVSGSCAKRAQDCLENHMKKLVQKI